jgi:CBS domain containing-hemolysin-like protein
MIFLYIGVFIFFLLLEGFFTCSEIALVSANHRQLENLAEMGHRGARMAQKMLRFPEKLFATTLLGANLAQTVNTVLVSALLINVYGSSGELAAVLVLPPIILIFAEILPKSIGRMNPTVMAQRVGFFIWLTSWILLPVTWIFAFLGRLVLWLTGSRGAGEVPFITREELQMVVKAGADEVDLETMERTIIQRILHFSQTMVREAMIPLIEVVAIPETYLVSQALEEFRRGPYSRLPVYRRRIDNIIGYLHSMELLGEKDTSQSIKKFIRPVRFAPESKRADQLLLEMQQLGIHLVVAVDEYGGAVGIVTLEDLLEEVVGEIADEFDRDTLVVKELQKDDYLINARMEIEALNESLKLNLPLGNYHTLGGFLIKQAGDIPRVGEQIRYRNLLFMVRNGDLRTIKEVEVHVEPSPGS